MTIPTTSKLIFAVITCLIFEAAVMADHDHDNSRCDVVSGNGTGSLLEGGRIVGTETFSVIGTGKQIETDFSMNILGTIEVDQATGGVTLASSHDFTGVQNSRVSFTTFEEIEVVPLIGNDATCMQNACGLIFTLKVETGDGRYNCGEIVSGFSPDPTAQIPFTSFIDPLNPAPNGDTLFLNTIGKLCHCGGND